MSCKQILIIEDDQAICQTMKDILEIQGYEVSIANDGQEGVDHLRKILPNPCVIVLDLMMPKANGWQFLDLQRADPQFSHIPVIVCSAFEESAKSVRPQAFVSKPVQLKQLIGAVKEFCA
ncbi:MAG: response regulator [Pseudobdellovibrionaceae bacterium]